MLPNKMDRPNQGIKCVVNTCHYYMSGDHCLAEKIEVQPRNASNTQETDCATFIPEGRAQFLDWELLELIQAYSRSLEGKGSFYSYSCLCFIFHECTYYTPADEGYLN